jgi:hypothetical protein
MPRRSDPNRMNLTTMTEKKMTLPIDPRLMNAIFRSDFVNFFRKCFATLSGTPLLMNWHIYALAHALEQVRRGKIKRLIINLPRIFRPIPARP